MSDEQKPGDPADKAADGGFFAWVTSHPTARLASGEGRLLLAENNRLRDDNAALRAAVERVRALHVGKQAFYPNWDGAVICQTCNRLFPCPTLRALEGTP